MTSKPSDAALDAAREQGRLEEREANLRVLNRLRNHDLMYDELRSQMFRGRLTVDLDGLTAAAVRIVDGLARTIESGGAAQRARLADEDVPGYAADLEAKR